MGRSSLRELGSDLLEDGKPDRALAVFAEAVRRQPEDHRSRMLAASCFSQMGEKERAVAVLQACAEGLLKRDFLLSGIVACKQALELTPLERRLKETLVRIHARAVRSAPGRAEVPPPLPPESLYDGTVQEDLMTLQGEELSSKAIEVLAASEPGAPAESSGRPPLPLFADLPRDAFIDLVVLMGYRTIKAGELITREGHGIDAIYIIVAGKAEVTRQAGKERKVLGRLGGGSILGELSLLTGASSTATVTATETVDLFEIRREHLNQVAKQHPSVMQVLVEFTQKRMANNLMATSPLFREMAEQDRIELFKKFAFRPLQENEKALIEGQHSPGLFMILAGELIVEKEDPAGGSVVLCTLREGDIVGEISLLTGLRATATVFATRKTAVAFLERSAFSDLIKSFPQIRPHLEGLSERRLKQIGEALRPAEIIDADELVMAGAEPRSGTIA